MLKKTDLKPSLFVNSTFLRFIMCLTQDDIQIEELVLQDVAVGKGRCYWQAMI